MVNVFVSSLHKNVVFNCPNVINTNVLYATIQDKTCYNDDFVVIWNGRLVFNDSKRSLTFGNGADVHLQLHHRVLGGKGGFGSMLRAIGAQIEKTTNKEACRDLSGRRLRDVNAEKRIKNWVQKQAEKEKEAERRKKEKLERLRSEPKVMFEDREYLAEREQIPGKIEDAVSYSLNKKKMAAVAKSTASSAAATVSTSTKDSEPDDSNESSNQASSSTSNDSNEDKGEAIQEVTTGESDVTIHSKEKINLKRKPTMEAKPAKKKKSALWLGDDLSDGDDEDNGDADTEEIIKKQKSLS